MTQINARGHLFKSIQTGQEVIGPLAGPSLDPSTILGPLCDSDSILQMITPHYKYNK